MHKVLEKLQRNAYGFAAFAFLGVAVAPAIIATQPVSAEEMMTARSIEMSSSAPSAAAQTYKINFTNEGESVIQGVVVHFCAESPIIGSATCTTPTGMTIGSTVGTVDGLTSGTWTGALDAGVLTITNSSGATVADNTNIEIPVSGFVNPSEAEKTFYARILTYATVVGAEAYTASTPGTHHNSGGVALSVDDSVNVSALVQETLTFCVSGSQPGDSCASTTEAGVKLGTGTPEVLDPQDVYTGTVYYQISTNAVGSTVVRIKSANAGLVSGSNSIPAIAGASSTAQAMLPGKDAPNLAAFGIRTAAAIATGTGTITPAAPYNSETNYGNNSTDITSTYGDDIATATGALLNKNVPLVFGATASPTTPAGVYTNQFSLIASSSY